MFSCQCCSPRLAHLHIYPGTRSRPPIVLLLPVCSVPSKINSTTSQFIRICSFSFQNRANASLFEDHNLQNLSSDLQLSLRLLQSKTYKTDQPSHQSVGTSPRAFVHRKYIESASQSALPAIGGICLFKRGRRNCVHVPCRSAGTLAMIVETPHYIPTIVGDRRKPFAAEQCRQQVGKC